MFPHCYPDSVQNGLPVPAQIDQGPFEPGAVPKFRRMQKARQGTGKGGICERIPGIRLTRRNQCTMAMGPYTFAAGSQEGRDPQAPQVYPTLGQQKSGERPAASACSRLGLSAICSGPLKASWLRGQQNTSGGGFPYFKPDSSGSFADVNFWTQLFV